MAENISNNLKKITERLQAACTSHKRDVNSVRLIAVSKTKPVQAILEALDAGQIDFGENYVQEFCEKFDLLADTPPHRAGDPPARPYWHFIGNLQRNKVKDIVGKVGLIHTVDDLKLAQQIDKIASEKKIVQDCLIQVKLAGEITKSGCSVEGLDDLIKGTNALSHIKIRGLMTIGTLTDDKDCTRQEYETLKNLRDDLNTKSLYKEPLVELSMGMSHDFEIAIACGATMIRVGTDIFGKRE